MSPPQSRLTAPDQSERPQLAPAWLIVLFSVVICLGLWLLYPRQDLEKRLIQTGETELANSYLHNLLRSDPNNPRLRLLLARREIAHGDTVSARTTLQAALQSNDTELYRQALWVQWELLSYEYWHMPPHPEQEPKRQAQHSLLRAHIRTLAQHDWPPEQTLQLAALASQFNEPEIAVALLPKPTLPETAAERALFYERAARDALAQGNYSGCAQFYVTARSYTTDPEQARGYYYAAVAALQSGNQPAAALVLAEQEIGPLANDTDTLFMLTQLARAAGRPDIAQQYVRRLLHMALEEQWRAMQQAQLQPQAQPFDDGAHLLIHPALHGAIAVVAPAPPVAQALPVAPARPALAFDDKTYSLGYDVFLENRNLEDAWAVAHAAVLQRPKDMRWRERLASVSEWTMRLPEALTHWLVLAQESNQEKAWEAVLRLAPGLFDEKALVLGLRYRLRQRPDDESLVRTFVAAQERTGEPRPALDYLREHARSPQTIELLAQLAERMGESELALQTWERLLTDPQQLTLARAMHAAVLAMSLNRADVGLQWLEAVQHLPSQPNEEAVELWRMTAGVAERRENYRLAVEAYRKLVTTPEAQIGDYDALIRLLLVPVPDEAAQVALQAWQRFDESRYIIQALMLYASRNRWDDFARALSLFDPDPLAQRHNLVRMRHSSQFLRLMGSYYQNTGHFIKARAYYEAGLKVEPDSADMRQALLWLFIDGNDMVALKHILVRHEQTWSMQEDVHDALAGAYQALSLPQIALDRYLTPRLVAHQHDFLWLMNYADALDQNQQSERAWQMRRYLLSQQWHDAQHSKGAMRLTPAQARAQWLTQEGMEATQRIARARLTVTQQPGDPAQAVLRELLRLDKDAQHNYSNAAAETAIGWLQDAGEYNAERGFLWHQYARSRNVPRNQPLWAEISVALADGDTAATGQLLQRFDERLPRYDRVNAAVAVHDLRLAQTAAFDAQTAQVDDHSTHLQLTQNLLNFSDYALLRVQASNLGAINETHAQAAWHAALNPRWSLDFELNDIRRHLNAKNVVRQTVDEQAAAVVLRWKHGSGQSQLRAALRQGYTNTTPLLFEHEHYLDKSVLLRGELGWQLPSEESLALRLGGMKTRWAMHVRYQGTRQDSFLLSQWGERYQLQTGAHVGSSSRSAIDYSHTYRLDAPLVQWGAFWSSHRFDRVAPSVLGNEGATFQGHFVPPTIDTIGRDYFLPSQFQLYGIRLSTNMQLEHDYTQALRPYASVSRTWHSMLGAGYDLRLGLAGSVFGADHLSMNWGVGKSGVDNLGLSYSLTINYRLHF